MSKMEIWWPSQKPCEFEQLEKLKMEKTSVQINIPASNKFPMIHAKLNELQPMV